MPEWFIWPYWLVPFIPVAIVLDFFVDASATLIFVTAALGVIPTAALDQAMGGTLPAAALLRAIAAGDQETAIRLGLVSLSDEDVAAADYATGARPRLAHQLRALLDRIEAEEAPT